MDSKRNGRNIIGRCRIHPDISGYIPILYVGGSRFRSATALSPKTVWYCLQLQIRFKSVRSLWTSHPQPLAHCRTTQLSGGAKLQGFTAAKMRQEGQFSWCLPEGPVFFFTTSLGKILTGGDDQLWSQYVAICRNMSRLPPGFSPKTWLYSMLSERGCLRSRRQAEQADGDLGLSESISSWSDAEY